jgi:regulator of cell morphogenesis and NO signaling
MIDSNRTLAALVTAFPAASTVLLRHRLDFCCRGDRPLGQACREAGIDPDRVVLEIEDELERARDQENLRSWVEAPLAELVGHIVERYHEPLRRDMPALAAAARRVQQVHRDKPSCPHGLAEHLEHMFEELTAHMIKEERVLFPLICTGRSRAAVQPVRVMFAEHEVHARAMARTRELTANLVAPAEACRTWRSLYDGLVRLEAELMAHVHLENHILFPRALAASPPGRS